MADKGKRKTVMVKRPVNMPRVNMARIILGIDKVKVSMPPTDIIINNHDTSTASAASTSSTAASSSSSSTVSSSTSYNLMKYDKVTKEKLTRYNNLPLNAYGHILLKIGSGSYGDIYLTDSDFVLKFVRHRQGNILEKDILNEIAYTNSLDHPGIIYYEDIYTTNDPEVAKLVTKYTSMTDIYTILVMSKYTGSLKNINSARTMKYETFLSLAFQIISSLAYLTSRNIIHGDIKPDNILYKYCDDDPHMIETVISDFGLATARECITRVSRGTRILTMIYQAPEFSLSVIRSEQARLKRLPTFSPPAYHNYDNSIDVWAAACTLYETYTGQKLIDNNLFTGFPKNLWENRLLFLLFIKLGPPNPVDTPDLFDYYQSLSLPVYVEKPLTDNDALNDLLLGMLNYSPAQRLSFFAAENHYIFDSINIKNNKCFQGYMIKPIKCADKASLFDRNWDFSQAVKYVPFSYDIIQFLYNVCRNFQFTDEHVFGYGKIFVLAAQIVYQYLNKKDNPKYSIELLGAATLYITSTFLLVDWFNVNQFINSSLVDKVTFAAAVNDTLQVIKYDLNATTPWDNLNGLIAPDDYLVSDTANKLLPVLVSVKETYLVNNKINPHLAQICLNLSHIFIESPQAEKISLQEMEDLTEAMISINQNYSSPSIPAVRNILDKINSELGINL